jgi:hypothetical protein
VFFPLRATTTAAGSTRDARAALNLGDFGPKHVSPSAHARHPGSEDSWNIHMGEVMYEP